MLNWTFRKCAYYFFSCGFHVNYCSAAKYRRQHTHLFKHNICMKNTLNYLKFNCYLFICQVGNLSFHTNFEFRKKRLSFQLYFVSSTPFSHCNGRLIVSNTANTYFGGDFLASGLRLHFVHRFHPLSPSCKGFSCRWTYLLNELVLLQMFPHCGIRWVLTFVIWQFGNLLW